MFNYCSPNNVTSNIMLKSYLEHGMFEDVKDLLHSILNGRIRSKVDLNQSAIADKFTFNTFMEACAEANRWDDFEYAFREMLSNGYHFNERRHLCMVLMLTGAGRYLSHIPEPLLLSIHRYPWKEYIKSGYLFGSYMS
jgi:pentatricopeptide repeat protein